MKSFYEFNLLLEQDPDQPQGAQPVNTVPQGQAPQQLPAQNQTGQADQEASQLLRLATEKFDQYVLPSLARVTTPQAKKEFLNFVAGKLGFRTDAMARQAGAHLSRSAASGQITTGQNAAADQMTTA